MSREAAEARARANLYGLVASMLAREPDEPLLQELNTSAFGEAAQALGLRPPSPPESRDAPAAYAELASEYARLFLVPGTPLRPYESVQRGEGRLWGGLTVDVQRSYHEAGFDLSPEAREVPDHLAIELEFMAHLANEEADRWEAGSRRDAEALRGLQRRFLGEHLGRWAGDFARSMGTESTLPYFRFVSEMLEMVVEADRAFLGVAPEEGR